MHDLTAQDMGQHAAAQGGVLLASISQAQPLISTIASGLVVAFFTWFLQQVSKGVASRLAKLEFKVKALEAEIARVRCPFTEAGVARCHDATHPLSAKEKPWQGDTAEFLKPSPT